MVVGADLGIAGQRRLDALQVLLRRRDALARDLEAHARLLELGGRGDLLLGEVRLPVELGLGEGLLAERRLDLLALGAPLGAQAADLGAHRLGLGLDAGQRMAVGLVVEPEQELAARDLLVLLHRHLDDDAGKLGRDLGAVALHIGIVGGDRAAGRAAR